MAALVVAGSTAGLLAVVGAGASPAFACGSAYADGGTPGWTQGPLYADSQPSVPPSGNPGYVGVGSSTGYAQASGTAGTGGVVGNVMLGGSVAGQSGAVGVGNDTNGSGGTAVGPAGYVCS